MQSRSYPLILTAFLSRILKVYIYLKEGRDFIDRILCITIKDDSKHVSKFGTIKICFNKNVSDSIFFNDDVKIHFIS